MFGGSGDDWLFGNDGIDRLWGDRGNDVSNGGRGNDIHIGGLGNDIFEFGSRLLNGVEVGSSQVGNVSSLTSSWATTSSGSRTGLASRQ